MSDVTQPMLTALLDSNKSLITSNESISESVRANSEVARATNEVVKTLAASVQELVTTERERVLKDKFQQEVNAKQEIVNIGVAASIKDSHDVIVRSKRFFTTFDKVSTGVVSLIVLAVLALLGFSFK